MMKYSCTRVSRGFTLVELMVTVALVAILAMTAIPSFKNTIIRNRVSAASSDLLAALNYARSEAITQGTDITLEEATSGGGLVSGWKITDSSGDTLKEHAALTEVSISGGSEEITFNRLGAVTTTGDLDITVTVTNCPAGMWDGQRLIEINATGRVKNTPKPCE
jgi:type IV fimbrial biogenesis protein FimT